MAAARELLEASFRFQYAQSVDIVIRLLLPSPVFD